MRQETNIYQMIVSLLFIVLEASLSSRKSGIVSLSRARRKQICDPSRIRGGFVLFLISDKCVPLNVVSFQDFQAKRKAQWRMFGTTRRRRPARDYTYYIIQCKQHLRNIAVNQITSCREGLRAFRDPLLGLTYDQSTKISRRISSAHTLRINRKREA